MNLFKMTLLTLTVTLTSNIALADKATDVEECTKEKTSKYSNVYQQCFPVVAKCWGWGAGDNSVYEYCSEREMKKRGGKINPSDKDSKALWSCGGKNADC